jgi:hypothetical protein
MTTHLHRCETPAPIGTDRERHGCRDELDFLNRYIDEDSDGFDGRSFPGADLGHDDQSRRASPHDLTPSAPLHSSSRSKPDARRPSSFSAPLGSSLGRLSRPWSLPLAIVLDLLARRRRGRVELLRSFKNDLVRPVRGMKRRVSLGDEPHPERVLIADDALDPSTDLGVLGLNRLKQLARLGVLLPGTRSRPSRRPDAAPRALASAEPPPGRPTTGAYDSRDQWEQ